MHLLVIEDDPKLGRLLMRLLQDDRHVVELAADGQSGLDIAREAAGIDAVILDVGLPDMSGLDVARRLRADGSRVGILMLTARDTLNDRVSGLDAGADDYLVKPFAFAELAARLRALGRRASPNVVRKGARLVNGPIELDEGLRRVSVDGRDVNLDFNVAAEALAGGLGQDVRRAAAMASRRRLISTFGVSRRMPARTRPAGRMMSAATRLT